MGEIQTRQNEPQDCLSVSCGLMEINKWARQSKRSWSDGGVEHEASSTLHTQKDDLESDGGKSESGHQTVIPIYWIKAGAGVSRPSVADQRMREEVEGGENGCCERKELIKGETKL